MEIKGLVWVGTATERYDATVAFFKDVLGLSVFHQHPGLTVLRAPGGEWVEVFGPGHEHFGEFDTGPVVEFLHENHSWEKFTWAHFRAPDGNIYGITSGPYQTG